MDNTSNIALSRMIAQSRAVEITANNIANVSTPGFQAERIVFSDWMVRQHGAEAPRGGETLMFTQDRATYRDQTQGTFTHTGNPLDLALGGDGYFQVQTANGVRLTRAGRFTLDATGTITDGMGNAVIDPNGQPLKTNPTDSAIAIAADGTVSVKTAAGQNNQIGKIAIVMPQNPYAMRRRPKSFRARWKIAMCSRCWSSQN